MRFLDLVEAVVGRRLLWKIGRRLYLHARREGSLDFEVNGEGFLQSALALRSAQRGKGLRIVDVGANYGQWSRRFLTTLARTRAPSAEFFLFEPVPAIAESVSQLASEFPGHRVMLEQSAVADNPGTARMIMTGSGAGNHHLDSSAAALEGEVIQVPVTTLDVRFGEEADIDLVKIDAEGFDPKVIAGMASLLRDRKVAIVQFEYSWLFIRSRSYLYDIFEMAGGCGYGVGLLTSRGIEAHEEWHSDLEKFNASAMVVFREDVTEWLPTRIVRYGPDNTHD